MSLFLFQDLISYSLRLKMNVYKKLFFKLYFLFFLFRALEYFFSFKIKCILQKNNQKFIYLFIYTRKIIKKTLYINFFKQLLLKKSEYFIY
jgi:hypothetical protein